MLIIIIFSSKNVGLYGLKLVKIVGLYGLKLVKIVITDESCLKVSSLACCVTMGLNFATLVLGNLKSSYI